MNVLSRCEDARMKRMYISINKMKQACSCLAIEQEEARDVSSVEWAQRSLLNSLKYSQFLTKSSKESFQ